MKLIMRKECTADMSAFADSEADGEETDRTGGSRPVTQTRPTVHRQCVNRGHDMYGTSRGCLNVRQHAVTVYLYSNERHSRLCFQLSDSDYKLNCVADQRSHQGFVIRG